MKTGRREREFIDKGREALLARVTSELKHADEADSVEQFIDAENTIEQYLVAVAEGATTLPESQDLAFACTILLLSSQTLQEADIELLARLSAPEVGTSMFAIAPQIKEMKTRAIARLEKLASTDGRMGSRTTLNPSDDGKIPF